MLFEQIEKFQCLKLSTALQLMVPSEDTWHVSRGHKRVVKLVNLFVQNLQKPYMIDLVTHSPIICDALWSICHIGGLWTPLKNYFVVLRPCDGRRTYLTFWAPTGAQEMQFFAL